MSFNLGTVMQLFADTVREPATMAARIKAQRAPHDVGWSVLGVATIGIVLLLHLERLLPGSSAQVTGMGGAPFLDAVVLGAMTVLMVFVFYSAGRSLGGDGSFGATLALMAWFQCVVLILVVAQVLIGLVMPPIAGLFAIFSFVLQVYILLHFMSVLHSYNSLAKAAGLLVVSIIGLGFGLAVIVVLIGGVAVAGGV
ncbi:YIP1 family protein [Yoonia sp. 208BN28-4]|uniref:YIP1 family protein n=1 Tax=Yoonia sp. 208BN28-4 TaxID=3126505 RepID=UPI0030A14252